MTTTHLNGSATESHKPSTVIAIKTDATSALVNLGYGKKLAADAVERTSRDLPIDATLDQVIKAALAHLKPAGGTPPTKGPNPQPMPNAAPFKALPPPTGSKKVEKQKPKTVGKMEAIEVPVTHLLAALHCVAKDETRYYLQGVFIHRTPEGFVRAVSTDGHRCLVANLYRETKDKPGPKWLSGGVIVPSDGLAARVKLIDKAQKDLELGVRIAWGENQPRVEITDDMGVNVFRVAPINASYPNYENVTTASWTGVGSERADWKPTGFKPAYLKAVADVAKALGSENVQCFDYAGEGGKQQPVLFTFGKEAEGVALFLMPTLTEDKMSEANRLLLAPSIKLTIAALKAHETRNLDAAKTLSGSEKQAALDKAEGFAKRIKDVLANAGSGNVGAALPAPKPEKPVAATGPKKATAPATAKLPKTEKKVVVGNGGRKPAAPKQAKPKAASKKKH